MLFGKLGPMELILILIITLVIFGPSKLPDIGKAFGKTIREFKHHANKLSPGPEEEKKTIKEDK